MLKTEAPIWERLRHLHRPPVFNSSHKPGPDTERTTLGQRLAERVAAGVGSWTFLGLQSGFLLLWLVYNTLAFTHHFDSFPYILLNLLLSFQAAFTGPVLLIAANVGAMRDHKQSDRIEQLTRQNEEMGERLLSVERLLEQHFDKTLSARASEIAEINALVREVHAAVCATNGTGIGTGTMTADSSQPGHAATDTGTVSAPPDGNG